MNKPSLKSDSPSLWLHLGASAFFRAHQAYYLNKLHQLGDLSWEMHLANIRNSHSQKILEQLKSQNGYYTLEIISPNGHIEYEPVYSLKNIILWNPSISNTVETGTHPNTKIISFTVTEGGYFLTDQGNLDLSHPDILNDLNSHTEIQTLYGALYLILHERMQQLGQQGAVTLLSCDNLRNNGESFKKGLMDFIKAKKDDALLSWVTQYVSAPNSMVDRITPKFDASIHTRMQAAGLKADLEPLTCERYTRWVVQDSFIHGRPQLERVGVEFVKDVTPYEEAKIRLLNASHSGLAWMGALINKAFIHETLDNVYIQTLIKEYAKEDVAKALKMHGIEIDTTLEIATILERFKNPYVKDTVARVSSDSISKLHGFIVPTIKDSFSQNHIPTAALKISALYFLFLEKHYAQQLDFIYEDRAFDTIDLSDIFTHATPEKAFVETEVLFGSLTTQTEFREHLLKAILEVKNYFALSRQSNNEELKK
ncbi:mannitol dehydrogenase family protein [Acinetobacter nectaris]|uniref:mannitol dehydrogenase family protein n=1 Tax=Acinetobacter nectaris TaxID=1219382 RepID=UPI001F26C6ED|nr:mannitol dehydrogenase family protein [Acinetobacter nectaris]MCF9034027.1 mannitol dehydrogenase family protein [Acinetobacter nectaris]